MPKCPKCSEENPARARFCLACGSPVGGADDDEPTEVRKTVTVMFADIAGSTALADRLDPEPFRRLLERFFDEMSRIIERHGGTIEQYVGDEVVAVFGVPTVHEDDALRATRAASEMQDALSALNRELLDRWGEQIDIRIALSTGEIVSGTSRSHRYGVLGDTANTASRLKGMAQPRDVLLDEATFRLTDGAVSAEVVGDLSLRGKDRAVRAHRLLQVHPGTGRTRRYLNGPLVGRTDDLALLQHTYRRASRERTAHLFTLLGPAGIGKSRLVRAFVEEATDACILQGRSLSYGDGITFWPLVEALRAYMGISDTDTAEIVTEKIVSVVRDEPDARDIAARLAEGVGLIGGQAPLGAVQETFWATRRLFETIARSNPLLVIFDDIHWAEPTFLRLIEHVVGTCKNVPVFVVCTARDELLEQEKTWGAGHMNASALRLTALRDEETDELVAALLGREPSADLRVRIHEASGGNPLFIEEVLAMLSAQPSKDGSGQAPEDGATAIPPTLQALLNARLEQLTADDRHLLERASVMGKVFDQEALEELLPTHLAEQRHEILERLEHTDLIFRSHGSTRRESYAFRHILIRDAAYGRLPKSLRADLHARFAEWLDQKHLQGFQYEEIIGYHFEQAYLNHSAVGSARDVSHLASLAAERLWSAGRRAARGDESAAVKLLTRAVSLASDTTLRARIMPDLADALRASGELDRARVTLEDAIAQAREVDPVVEAQARLMLLDLQLFLEPEGKAAEAERELQILIPQFEQLGDDVALARAYRFVASVRSMEGRWGEIDEPARRALEHARRAGHPREEAEAWMWRAVAAYFGPTPADEAVAFYETVLNEVRDHRRIRAVVLGMRAGMTAMQGDFSGARTLIGEARDIYAQLGTDPEMIAFWSGPLEMLAGNPGAAEEDLRACCSTLQRLGDKSGLSTMHALVAEALFLQGRHADALQETRESENLSASEDLTSQVLWRTVRGKVLARTGEVEAALGLVEEAVRVAHSTDMLNMQGDALMSYADVLRVSGADPAPAMREAIARYRAKGNTVASGSAAAELERLLTGVPGTSEVAAPAP